MISINFLKFNNFTFLIVVFRFDRKAFKIFSAFWIIISLILRSYLINQIIKIIIIWFISSSKITYKFILTLNLLFFLIFWLITLFIISSRCLFRSSKNILLNWIRLNLFFFKLIFLLFIFFILFNIFINLNSKTLSVPTIQSFFSCNNP